MPAPPYPALCPGPVGVCVGLHWLVRFPPPEMSWSKIEIITKIANYDFSGVNCTKSWKKCVKSSAVIYLYFDLAWACFWLLSFAFRLDLLSFAFFRLLYLLPQRALNDADALHSLLYCRKSFTDSRTAQYIFPCSLPSVVHPIHVSDSTWMKVVLYFWASTNEMQKYYASKWNEIMLCET